MKIKLDPMAALISGSIILIVLFGAYLLKVGFDQGLIALPSFSRVPSLSANAYYLTPPVTLFTGKITKIDKDVVTVSFKFTPASASPLAEVSPTPTPTTREVVYRFKITSTTYISQPPASPIPYHFKKLPENAINPALLPGTPSLSPDKLKLNQAVTVYSTQDLRLASVARQPVPAQSIILPPVTNSVTGSIITISGNRLTLRVTTPTAHDYTVSITNDTEISVPITSGNPKFNGTNLFAWEKLTPADLKPNMTVTVYSTADLSENQNPQAALISPIY